MTFKVTNLSEVRIKVKSPKGDIFFGSKETKVLDFNPNSSCFHVEKIEEPEKQLNKPRRLK